SLPRLLPSFPTRRSSDLIRVPARAAMGMRFICGAKRMTSASTSTPLAMQDMRVTAPASWLTAVRLKEPEDAKPPTKEAPTLHRRSEEHTSELQSRENLVC